MFEYVSVKEMASKWEISERRIQKLCEENRIKGVQRFGRSWMIPKRRGPGQPQPFPRIHKRRGWAFDH